MIREEVYQMALLDLQTMEISAEAERGGKSAASKGCSHTSLLLCFS